MKMKNLLQFSLGFLIFAIVEINSESQRPSLQVQNGPGLVQPYQANSFSNPNYVNSAPANQNPQNQRPQIQPIRERDPENPERPPTIKFPTSSNSVDKFSKPTTFPDREARELSSSADTSSYYRSAGIQRQTVAQTQDSRHLFPGFNWGIGGGYNGGGGGYNGGGYNGGGYNGGGYNGGNREKPGTCYRGGGGFGSNYNHNAGYYYARRSDVDTEANTIDVADSARSSTEERIKREAGYGYSSNSGGYGGGGGYYSGSAGGGYNPGGGYSSGGGYHGGNGIYPTTTYRPGFGSSYCRRSDYECPGNQKCCSGICTNPATIIG